MTIPERSWARFRDVLTEFIDKVDNKDGGPSTSGSGAGALDSEAGAEGGDFGGSPSGDDHHQQQAAQEK